MNVLFYLFFGQHDYRYLLHHVNDGWMYRGHYGDHGRDQQLRRRFCLDDWTIAHSSSWQLMQTLAQE